MISFRGAESTLSAMKRPIHVEAEQELVRDSCSASTSKNRIRCILVAILPLPLQNPEPLGREDPERFYPLHIYRTRDAVQLPISALPQPAV